MEGLEAQTKANISAWRLPDSFPTLDDEVTGSTTVEVQAPVPGTPLQQQQRTLQMAAPTL